MAFKFNWTTFDKEFIEEAKDRLTEALNEGIKTEMIGNIKVKELNMGTKAPELEVMEIGDLSEEKFKGIFKITYQGDAYLVIQTIVQINPLVIPETPITLSLGNGVIAADQPLPIPVKLRISNLKLSGIATLVLSNKGITFCFKNDPLEAINVSSTFDNIPSIKKLIQSIIKTQISAFLLEDVPELIHNFSNGSNNTTNKNVRSRSYSNDTFISSTPNSYDGSIYEDDDNSFNANQTLLGEENDMEWKRKWIGNDLNSNSSFQNRIILYRGLKCSKSVNANRGILRLLNPSFNNYLCQSIHIDSWLITPPFSPIPLYIPKASYPSYTKDKHFSIVDYLRRTAITRAPQRQRIGSDVNGYDPAGNNDTLGLDNPFKRLQQSNENSTTLPYIPSPILSPLSTNSSTLFDNNSENKNSNDNLLNNNSHHGYNYTHTYHRGQRKTKPVTKSNNLRRHRSSSSQASSSVIFSDPENETLVNTSSSFINLNGNKDIEYNNNMNLTPNSMIPNLSSPRLSVYGAGNRGHVRGYSNQTSISETSNQSSVVPSTSSNKTSQTGNDTISNDNVFLSLLNNNNSKGTSVNIYSRNSNISNGNVNMKPSGLNNVLSGYNSDGESTVCEEFPAEIVIEPSNNSMAAQLTNLMNSNQTISPYTRTLEHYAYRSFPHSKSNYKRRSHRQRHRLKIHVDGLMSSSSSSLSNNLGNRTQSSLSSSSPISCESTPVLNN